MAPCRGPAPPRPRPSKRYRARSSPILLLIMSVCQMLTTEVLKVKMRGDFIRKTVNAERASRSRDGVTQELYGRIFDWFVHLVSKTTAPDSVGDDGGVINILDLFGFEDFEPTSSNGLEQLLINFSNEALQAVFNRTVIQSERELYLSEGFSIASDDIGGGAAVHDSDACLRLLAGGLKVFGGNSKGETGVFKLLGANAKLPKPSDSKFLSVIQSDLRCDLFPAPHPKDKRDTFIVVHYARAVKYVDVCAKVETKSMTHAPVRPDRYRTGQFVIADAYAPPTGTSELLDSSVLWSTMCAAIGGDWDHNDQSSAAPSVSARFAASMGELQKKLDDTSCSFIRCVKPNMAMCPGEFDRPKVAEQLQALGVSQVHRVVNREARFVSCRDTCASFAFGLQPGVCGVAERFPNTYPLFRGRSNQASSTCSKSGRLDFEMASIGTRANALVCRGPSLGSVPVTEWQRRWRKWWKAL